MYAKITVHMVGIPQKTVFLFEKQVSIHFLGVIFKVKQEYLENTQLGAEVLSNIDSLSYTWKPQQTRLKTICPNLTATPNHRGPFLLIRLKTQELPITVFINEHGYFPAYEATPPKEKKSKK